jgi:hypothetical protein
MMQTTQGTTLNLPTIAEQGLTLAPVMSDGARVRFSGSGDTEGVALFERFLGLLHEEVVTLGHKQIAVDLEQLTFINSSCLKALVSWIYKVDTSGRPYTIRLVRNPRMHWQKSSLSTLQRLAPQVVIIEDSPIQA